MADIGPVGMPFTLGVGTQGTNGTNNYLIGNAAEGVVGRFLLHIVAAGGGWSGSVTVKGRAKGSGAAFLAIPYKRRYVGGAVSDDTTVSAAITGTAIIDVDAAGLDVSLEYTHTSGSATVNAVPLAG